MRELDKAKYVGLLRRLIAQSKYLQNNPRLGILPEEKRAARIVMEELAPYSKEQGGPLIIEERAALNTHRHTDADTVKAFMENEARAEAAHDRFIRSMQSVGAAWAYHIERRLASICSGHGR